MMIASTCGMLPFSSLWDEIVILGKLGILATLDLFTLFTLDPLVLMICLLVKCHIGTLIIENE